MDSIVAKNIRRIIAERCLSKGAIGKKAGYDIKKFSNMINGRKKLTDTEIAKIADALNVPPNELFDEEKAEAYEAARKAHERKQKGQRYEHK